MVAFSSYKDTLDSIFDVPACLTWVRGKKVEEVARLFGGRPEQISEGHFVDLYDAYEMEEDGGIVLITQAGDWILAVELTRYRGAKPDVLRGLSADGEALALAWSIEWDATFTYASAGRIDVAFDPVRQATSAYEAEYLEWSRAYGISPQEWQDDWRAAAFTIAESRCGIRIDRDWKDQAHLVLRVEEAGDEEPDQRPPLKLPLHMRELISRHPRVATIVASPPIEEFTEGTLIVAELAVGAAGLRESLNGDLVEEALAAIATGCRGEQMNALRDSLDDLAESLAAQASQVMQGRENIHRPDPNTDWGQLLMKHHAVKALSGALSGDPYEGLTLALQHASTVTAPTRKQNDDYRLLRLLEALGFYIFKGYNSF
ncbi:DUF6461 domain-containing protein [Nonomuraea jabiensis]|uniref:DUF6461 domain-containing protein n=1 Tax=Nonomuraea jabiensis TaxID=882448 RepID=UPI0036C30F15